MFFLAEFPNIMRRWALPKETFIHIVEMTAMKTSLIKPTKDISQYYTQTPTVLYNLLNLMEKTTQY